MIVHNGKVLCNVAYNHVVAITTAQQNIDERNMRTVLILIL
jgi:hypothetical protein